MKGSALLPLFIAALTPLLILTIIVASASSGGIGWRPAILWTNTFGNPARYDSATVIASDSSGIYVEGYVNSSGAFGDGPGNLFLSKYRQDGEIIWLRTIGDTNSSYINGMSISPDGIYLSEANRTGWSIQKYDLTGNKLWEKEFDIGNIQAIASTPTDVFVAGIARNALFVREYDKVGNLLWTDTFANSTYGEAVTGLYASGSGAYVVGNDVVGTPPKSGVFFINYGQNGQVTWSHQPPGGTSEVSGDSTAIYLTGQSLYKYDLSGNLVWQTPIDSPDSSEVTASSNSVDSSGVYVSAMTYRSHDFLARYDLNGNKVWSISLPTTAQDFNGGVKPYRLTAGLEGVYIAGAIGGNGGSGALVEGISSSSSLVVFGVNPPLSFVILGGPIGISVASLFLFRKLRRKRIQPRRIGPAQRSLPIAD